MWIAVFTGQGKLKDEREHQKIVDGSSIIRLEPLWKPSLISGLVTAGAINRRSFVETEHWSLNSEQTADCSNQSQEIISVHSTSGGCNEQDI